VENLLPKGMLGTPRRTVVAGIAALVVATILLLVYLSHYRSSVESENANVQVLVAKHFIKKGTSAESLARTGGYDVLEIPKDQLRNGAIIDAGAINGQITSSDIYPKQQLTEDDFGATSGTLSASSDLLGNGPKTGTWRAIAITPLDDAHGISPQAQTGDHVDAYVQMDARTGLLMQDVLILAAPGQVAAGTSAPTSPSYILRVPTKDVTRFAYAADNGKIWFVLRPQDEKQTKPAGTTPANSANVILGQ
jgi:Flp pilus assembly protein CpaB